MCKSILLDNFIAKVRNIANRTEELDIFPAIYSAYDIFYSIHPLVVNCIEAPDQAIPFVKSRFDDAQDPKLLITNVVHNFDVASETALDVWNFLETSERG